MDAFVVYGQVNCAVPETIVEVPLLASAVMLTPTVPAAPVTHCTVAVLLPVETILAIGPLVGLSTTNWP